MKFRGLVWSLLLVVALTASPLGAEKLMLAHVAINPAQGMLLLAKDSGILAKYGFSADVLLIPGTPRTIQALLAGDLDYVAAGAPASLRARAQGADVVVLSTLANSSSQRVVVKADSQLTAFKDLKGKIDRRHAVWLGRRYVFAGRAQKDRYQGKRGYDLANGRHARRGSRSGIRTHRSRRARRLGHALGVSRFGKAVEGRERARDGLSRSRCADHDHRA